MGIRTPDLLHAISRHPVHRSPAPQVTVLSRAPVYTHVRTGCGTSVLYSLQAIATHLQLLRHRCWPLKA